MLAVTSMSLESPRLLQLSSVIMAVTRRPPAVHRTTVTMMPEARKCSMRPWKTFRALVRSPLVRWTCSRSRVCAALRL